MTASDLAAVIVSVCAVAAVALLAAGMVVIGRAVRELRASVQQLRDETLPVVADLKATVRDAAFELDRAEDVLVDAQVVTARVGALARLLHLLLANPIIKVLSLASGTSRAARSLRRSAEP